MSRPQRAPTKNYAFLDEGFSSSDEYMPDAGAAAQVDSSDSDSGTSSPKRKTTTKKDKPAAATKTTKRRRKLTESQKAANKQKKKADAAHAERARENKAGAAAALAGQEEEKQRARRKTAADQLSKIKFTQLIKTEAIEVPSDNQVEKCSPFFYDFGEANVEIELAWGWTGNCSKATIFSNVSPDDLDEIVYQMQTIQLRSSEGGEHVVAACKAKQGTHSPRMRTCLNPAPSLPTRFSLAGFTIRELLKAVELCEEKGRKQKDDNGVVKLKGIFFDGACGFTARWE